VPAVMIVMPAAITIFKIDDRQTVNARSIFAVPEMASGDPTTEWAAGIGTTQRSTPNPPWSSKNERLQMGDGG